jgi:Uma2 family endonuclease
MATEAKKLFTVEEYYKMAEAGIFRNARRTELINGEIIEMTSMGSRHAAAISRATTLLVRLFGDRTVLRPQLPAPLNEFNEPEPDIALVKPRKDSYSTAHPEPSDPFLIMEISDTSLKYDRDVKLPIYAEAGIPEVWILDLTAENLLVYRDPARKSYTTSLRFSRGESVSCLSFAEISVKVEDLY